MKLSSWILLILFTVIFFLILSIITYRSEEQPEPEDSPPEKTGGTKEPETQTEEIPLTEIEPLFSFEEEEPEPDHTPSENLLRDVRLRWPGLSVMMTPHVNGTALALDWKGLAQDERRMVLITAEAETFERMMRAAERILDTNVKPVHTFTICMVTNKEKGCADLKEILTSYKESILDILSDGPGIRRVLNEPAAQAGVLRRASIRLSAVTEEPVKDLLPDLSVTLNAEQKDFLHSIRKRMKTRMYLQSKIPFTNRCFMENLFRADPGLRECYSPYVSVSEDNEIILYADTQNGLEKALSEIIDALEAKGIAAECLSQKTASQRTSSEAGILGRLRKALKDVYGDIPVMTGGVNEAWDSELEDLSESYVRFSFRKGEGAGAVISFYESYLKAKEL